MQTWTVENRTIVRVLAVTTAFVLGIWLAILLRREIVWIGAALFLAVALDPAVSWIARKTRAGRIVATIVVVIIFLAVLGFLTASLIPPLVAQSEQLVANLPHLVANIENSPTYIGRLVRHYNLVAQLKNSEGQIITDLTHARGLTLGIVRSVFASLTATVTIMALTFFMLLEGPKWIEDFWRFVPAGERGRYQKVAARIYEAVSGYVTGNLLFVVLTGVLVTVLLTVTGVNYAIPLGLLAGLLTLLPLIGVPLAGVILVIVAAFSSLTAFLVVATFFVIYALLDGHVIKPLLYGRTVQMSALFIIIALLLATALGGILGALLAIPTAAVIKIFLEDAVQHSSVHRKN